MRERKIIPNWLRRIALLVSLVVFIVTFWLSNRRESPQLKNDERKRSVYYKAHTKVYSAIPMLVITAFIAVWLAYGIQRGFL